MPATIAGDADHYANFVDAVRARDASLLNAPIVEGHVSSALCHLGNLSHQLGAVAEPSAIRDAVAADTPLSEACARLREHLGANAVDLGVTPLSLGRRVDLDPATEGFVGELAERAAVLARGSHRAPFALPEV